jgi:outer membrane protein assembly factor BamD (BamD/ComL family)
MALNVSKSNNKKSKDELTMECQLMYLQGQNYLQSGKYKEAATKL